MSGEILTSEKSHNKKPDWLFPNDESEVQKEINFKRTNVWKQETEIKKHITYLPLLWSTFPIQHTTTKIFLDDDNDFMFLPVLSEIPFTILQFTIPVFLSFEKHFLK